MLQRGGGAQVVTGERKGVPHARQQLYIQKVSRTVTKFGRKKAELVKEKENQNG